MSGWRHLLLLVFPIVSMLSVQEGSWAREGRVALVIGNAAYVNAPVLANPVNDARDVAALLRKLSFDVIEETDVDLRRLGAAVSSFIDKASVAEAALFYYAGHGLQDGVQNYLLPVDAKIENTFSLRTDTLSVADIVAELEAVSDVNLVFLDACRDNPFADRLRQTFASRGSGSVGRGLARVDPRGANTMIAFAATAGQVALDGDGRNSPFTTAFIANVSTSGEEIATLFKSVIRDVRQATDGRQQPQMMSAMSINFYFNPTINIGEPVAPAVGAAQTAYEAAERIGTLEAFQTVAEHFPGTIEASLATAAIAKLQQAAVEAEAKAKAEQEIALAPAAVESAAEPQPKQEAPKLSDDPQEAETQLALSTQDYSSIQGILATLGFDAGATDGNFGAKSRTALRAFQRAYRVEESGYIDGRTKARLDAIVRETPRDYQGLWSLEIHRYNYNRSDPGSINSRTHLASAQLRVRGNEVFVVSSLMLSTEHNEFDTFSATLNAAGTLSMSMKATYLFQKSRIGNLSIRHDLPELFPYGRRIEIRGNRVEDDIWFMVKLSRVKS